MSHPWTVRAVRDATRVTPKSALFYVGYTGAGTVEFIVDADRPDDFFWLASRPDETILTVEVGT